MICLSDVALASERVRLVRRGTNILNGTRAQIAEAQDWNATTLTRTELSKSGAGNNFPSDTLVQNSLF